MTFSFPSWNIPRPSEMMTSSWEMAAPDPARCCWNSADARDSKEITLVLFWSNLQSITGMVEIIIV